MHSHNFDNMEIGRTGHYPWQKTNEGGYTDLSTNAPMHILLAPFYKDDGWTSMKL